MIRIIQLMEAQTAELGHSIDPLKVDIEEGEGRVKFIHASIKEKVAEMMNMGQEWGWCGQNKPLIDAYHLIVKTFGAEGQCKDLKKTATLSEFAGDRG